VLVHALADALSDALAAAAPREGAAPDPERGTVGAADTVDVDAGAGADAERALAGTAAGALADAALGAEDAFGGATSGDLGADEALDAP
jgi:hypothetical protein